MKIKWFCAAQLSVGLSVVLLAGCIREQSIVQEGMETDDGIVLSVCISADETERRMWESLGRLYLEDQEHIDGITWVLASADTYESRISMDLSAGKLPDIVMVDGGSMLRSWSEQLIPLETELKGVQEIDPFLLCGSQWKEQYYTLPVALYGVGIFYNMDLLDQVGWTQIPQTRSELKQLCEALAEENIRSFINPYQNIFSASRTVLTQMISQKEHPDLYRALLEHGNQKPIEEDEDWQELMDFVDLTLRYGNKRRLEIGRELARDYFGTGRYAMITYESSSFEKHLPQGAYRPEKVRIGCLPLSDDPEKNRLQIRVMRLGITRACEYQEEAEAFLNWLCTDKAAIEYIEGEIGGFSPAAFESGRDAEDTRNLTSWLQEERPQEDIKAVLPYGLLERVVPVWSRYIAGEIGRADFYKEMEQCISEYADAK